MGIGYSWGSGALVLDNKRRNRLEAGKKLTL